MPKTLQTKFGRTIAGLMTLAAVAYNSWPLGYWLNNQTARYGLASDLELTGQPYYWLFVAGDVVSGSLVMIASALVWQKLGRGRRSKIWTAALAGLFIFGLFTAVSALLPSQCTLTPVFRCGAGLGRGLGLDATISSLAALGLLGGLLGATWLNRTRNRRIWLAVAGTSLVAWLASGLTFAALALANQANQNAHLSQYALMILSGEAVIVTALSLISAV